MHATALSLSNIQYSVLKHKTGLRNWGFLSVQEGFDFDLNELDDILDEMMLIGDTTELEE
jgi:hypothetical protein